MIRKFSSNTKSNGENGRNQGIQQKSKDESSKISALEESETSIEKEKNPRVKTGSSTSKDDNGATDSERKETENESDKKTNVDISKDNYEKLSKQLREGYYFSEIRKATDKNFKLVPTDRKIRKLNKEAYPFPSFEGDLLYDGTSVQSILSEFLLGRKIPVTLVLVSFRQSGYLQLGTWRDVFDRTFINYPNIRSCQITFEDRWYMKALKFLMVRGHKKKTPSSSSSTNGTMANSIPRDITMDISVERQKSTFIRFGDTEKIREALQISNRMSGYVFLIDGRGNIRWRASGEPHERDLQMMQEVALEMIREMKSNRGMGKGKL